MLIEIKHRNTGAVLYAGEGDNIRQVVEAAVAAKKQLREANLYGAYLRCANLGGADLGGANLGGANLYGADLRCANNTSLAIARTRILPEGTLIGWKKCQHGVIVKLRIPEAAKRSSAFRRKCRAEYVEVLEVIGADVGLSIEQGYGGKEYRVGETVRAHKWCEDFVKECAAGIHFYITREEAEAHR